MSKPGDDAVSAASFRFPRRVSDGQLFPYLSSNAVRMSVDRLRAFIKRIESGNSSLSENEMHDLGKALMVAAKERAGYAGLAWEAGVYLLILASERPDIGVDN